ncbi:MAG: SdpI family protein [Flavobacteriales bacterium]|nr:SdpI family protein [Flavobacteriales bacterium]
MEDYLKTILIVDFAIFSSLIIYYFIPKDEINPILGYRTKRAMKNINNWKFAQSFFSKNWLYSIPLMLITQLPILINKKLFYLVEWSLINFAIYTIYLIVILELKLKKMDSKNKK